MHRTKLVLAVLLAIGICSSRAAFATTLLTPGTLVEGDPLSGKVNEFLAGGHETTFASGLNHPLFLAFNSSSNLFVSDNNNNQSPGYIQEFTPGGGHSTFASGLNNPVGLAFNSTGVLFEADSGSNTINTFTPGGSKSSILAASPQLFYPSGLAFAPAPVPEPSSLVLFGLAAIGMAVVARRRMQKRVE